MNQTYFDKALSAEHLRQKLARQKNYQQLKESYQLPEIPNTNTSKQWDHQNRESEFTFNQNPMAWDRTRKVCRLIQKYKANADTRVLDIGFGPTNIEASLYPKYSNEFDWHGIDISTASVKLAKLKFPKFNFKVGRIETLNYSDSHFDLILALEVLEHISPKHIFSALSEVHRVLKPAGLFIISVPLNEGLEEMIRHNSNPNSHVRMYTPALLTAELHLAGFKVIHQQTLFAFGKLYFFKTALARLTHLRRPNNLILVAKRVDPK